MKEFSKRIWKCYIRGIHKKSVSSGECIRCGNEGSRGADRHVFVLDEAKKTEENRVNGLSDCSGS